MKTSFCVSALPQPLRRFAADQARRLGGRVRDAAAADDDALSRRASRCRRRSAIDRKVTLTSRTVADLASQVVEHQQRRHDQYAQRLGAR